jgi:cysteine desulfurase family protein (TIGR01976 family)
VNRDRFPGLADGWARFDAPAGAQPVDSVIEAMAGFMRSGAVANQGGFFEAAERVDALVDEARATAGSFLGVDPHCVVFGPSMTTLTLSFAAAVGRTLAPGDEIVCTRLDHDANVAPWLIAAARAGVEVRFAEPERETLELPAAAVEAVLSPRTRWVAVTAASNAVGTIPDLPGIVAAAHGAGARVFVDAVHATPHRAIDVAALGCDALACSAYKWFGPHIGILWGLPDVLAELSPDKLRPSPDTVPERWELGTLPFESLIGVRAAADFLVRLDREELRAHEDRLLAQMVEGLGALGGVKVHGAARDRTATVMFTVDGHSSHDVAAHLARAEIAVWHGNYYALELSRWLGLEPDGALRAGVVAYNDSDEVDRLLEAVAELSP